MSTLEINRPEGGEWIYWTKDIEERAAKQEEKGEEWCLLLFADVVNEPQAEQFSLAQGNLKHAVILLF